MSDLISSVESNNLEEVIQCLARGEDVNTRDEDGWTALMFACGAGNTAIVSRLVKEILQYIVVNIHTLRTDVSLTPNP